MASSGRWQSLAAANAALRFSPQRSALQEALREAQQTYGQTVRSANTSATLTQRAAAAAKPAVRAAYSRADAATQPGVTLVSQALAALPGVANQFKADSANEVQQQIANLASARARDESLLHQEGVSARAGAQFAQTNARGALQQAVSGLLSKNSKLAGEQGAYAATEAEKLAHEAEGNEQQERASQRSAAQQERASERTASTSRTNAQEANAAKRAAAAAAAGKPYLLSNDKQAEGASKIDSIKSVIEAHYHGLPRGEIAERLSRGIDHSGKTSKGNTVSVKIPPYTGVLVTAALDAMENEGHVTPATLKALHERGYSVQRLGLQGPLPAAKRRAIVNASVQALQPLR